MHDEVECVVIGAGQGGLAVSYDLTRRGVTHVVLDGAAAIGDSWRRRWDSLRLFSNAGFTRLPGLPFPAPRRHEPSKDAMADYLAEYARRFQLPVLLERPVHRLHERDGLFEACVPGGSVTGRAAVLATGPAARPRVPDLARELRADIVQMHSSQYRNPDGLPDGRILVVGAGNSGVEVALDLAGSREVLLAGRDTGRLPIRIGGPTYRVMNAVFRADTPQGRWFTSGHTGRGTPVVRATPADLVDAGVRRGPRMVGVEDGRPRLEDGRTVDCSALVWCTGYVPDYGWIDIDGVPQDRHPPHRQGAVIARAGLYVVGLPFQRRMASSLVGGVGRDARYVGGLVAARVRASGVTVDRQRSA